MKGEKAFSPTDGIHKVKDFKVNMYHQNSDLNRNWMPKHGARNKAV